MFLIITIKKFNLTYYYSDCLQTLNMMPAILPLLISLAALGSTALAETDQKLLGPSFTPPSNVLSSNVIQEAVLNVTSALNNAIRTGKSTF